MRLVLKILAVPFILITGLLYGVCKLFLILSGMMLGILSGLALLASIGILISSGWLPGLICVCIAFLISPFGLPKIAAWMTGKLGGVNYALRDFVTN